MLARQLRPLKTPHPDIFAFNFVCNEIAAMKSPNRRLTLIKATESQAVQRKDASAGVDRVTYAEYAVEVRGESGQAS